MPAATTMAATGVQRAAWLLLAFPIAAAVVLLLGGIPPAVLGILVPFNVLMSAFVHANLNWSLGPFKYVLARPSRADAFFASPTAKAR